MCVLAGCGFVVAATIAVVTLVRTRPLHGVVWLLFPGIAVLVACTLWAIWILGPRQPDAERLWGKFRPGRPKIVANWSFFFGDLPRAARVAVVAIALLFVVSGFTAFPAVTGLGHPLPPTRHCKYRVNEQGTATCTNEATYYRAGRDDQRYVASWFAAVFVLHLGVAAGQLGGRRRED